MARSTMRVVSPDFEHGSWLSEKHTKLGENVAPRLQISGVPAETKELVVVCHDPDAPRPDGFTHWILYGVPPSTAEIAPLLQSSTRCGPNDFGNQDYDGPKPPPGHGTHHYFFWVYALDSVVEGSPSRQEFLETYGSSIIDQARIVGTYETAPSRQQPDPQGTSEPGERGLS